MKRQTKIFIILNLKFQTKLLIRFYDYINSNNIFNLSKFAIDWFNYSPAPPPRVIKTKGIVKNIQYFCINDLGTSGSGSLLSINLILFFKGGVILFLEIDILTLILSFSSLFSSFVMDFGFILFLDDCGI